MKDKSFRSQYPAKVFLRFAKVDRSDVRYNLNYLFQPLNFSQNTHPLISTPIWLENSVYTGCTLLFA